MLTLLSIRNFVIVDKIELEFSSGFTVLTGETGAGKSIMIDALSLALGERGDSSQIRQGCERAEISALFDIDTRQDFQDWLHQQDLSGDPNSCVLRRILDVNGRSRASINGHTVTLQQLRAAGEFLVAIHSQHAHQALLQKTAQRDLLDAYAGCRELAQSVKTAYQNWQDLYRARVACEQQLSESQEKRVHLEQQRHELETLNFSVDEWETLQADHNRLAHLAGLLEATEASITSLSDSDTAVASQIHAVKNQLQNMLDYDAQLQAVVDMLDSAQIQVQESIYELRHYREQLDLDPQSLQAIEQRITAIHGTARKYRVEPETLAQLMEDVCTQLDALPHGGSLDAMTEQEQAAQAAYRQQAEKLTAARHKAGTEMAQAVTDAMQTMAMEGGTFTVAFEPLEQGGGAGLEQVEFQVAAHKSMALKPLAKVASGGELSRISLAIQVITSRTKSAPTLIFDEVDVGIGGRVAEIVGRLLKQLGQTRQVMSVTHLPQVAATGDQHLQVAKWEDHDSQQIQSRITTLNDSERIEEVARMLGGVKMTEATRQHAAEMLQNSSAE